MFLGVVAVAYDLVDAEVGMRPVAEGNATASSRQLLHHYQVIKVRGIGTPILTCHIQDDCCINNGTVTKL